MNSRSHFRFLALLLALSLVATSQASVRVAGRTSPALHQSATAPAPVTIPFELAGRHIILKVKINNSRPLTFVLDTGDKYAIVDLALATDLGLNLHGTVHTGGAGAGAATGAFVRDANFTVEGLPGFSQPVTLALTLRQMSGKLGRDFDGIIGHDFIKNFVVEIDYQKQLLKLHNKDQFKYTGTGESLPIRINGAGHPIVKASVTPVNGESFSGEFVLDIGSGLALALHTPVVNERKLPGSNVKTIKALGIGGAGGSVNGEFGRVAELKLGSYSIKQPITLFSHDTAGALATSSLVGNIGGQITNKFRLFLDYNRDRIIFEPNSDFAKPFDRAFTGLSIQAEGADYRTFRVTGVLDGSPASEVSLQKDDVIQAVNGKPASEFTLSKLTELLERPVEYDLTIKRGAQTMKIKVKPRHLI